MDTTPSSQKQFVKLGFSKEETKDMVDSLNLLLSNLSVFYQKLRNYHWNVQGSDFFDLHVKFEEIYTLTAENVDLVAERIRVFGHTPLSRLSDYLENSQIEETGTGLSSREMVLEVIGDLETVESFLIDAADISGDVGDIGTSDLISRMTRQYEKEHWMLSAFSSKS